MLYRVYTFIFILCFLFVETDAQNKKFEHYNDADGLSHNSVRHIVQDKHGFLWLGTFGGLNRFDGYGFKSYLSSSSTGNSINDDDITVLCLDEDNDHMWIGTTNGLSLLKMNAEEFVTYLPDSKNPNSISDAEIRSVYIDKFKRVWIGTKTQGLCILNAELNSFKKVEIEGLTYIKTIFEDSEGYIWIGSYNTSGVIRIRLDDLGEIKEIKKYELQISDIAEVNPYVYFIYEDHKSDIFVGTREGLYKWDKTVDELKALKHENVLEAENLGSHYTCVTREINGKYWVGTIRGLVVCDSLENIPKGEFELNNSVLSENTSLVDNLISALYFDRSGVLWVGTENGLDKYDPFDNQLKYLNGISTLIGNKVPRISGFAKTHNGHLIVATHDNGLFISKDGKFETLLNTHKEIASIYTFDGKTFYCGMWNGNILVFDYLQQEAKILDAGFEGIPVFAFCKIDHENMIIGSFGQGAVTYNFSKGGIDKSLQTLIPDYEIHKIVRNEDGIMWFATETGVLRFDPSQNALSKYENELLDSMGISHNNVKDILIDEDGKLWAATRVGLNYYDNYANNFRPVLNPEVLQKSWVTEMEVDTDGYMWLNLNNNRIAKYDVESKEVDVYYVESGNRLDIFSLGGFYYDKGSNIYIGGKNGIIYFSPQDLRDCTISLAPYISKFQIENKEVRPGQKINGTVVLNENINVTKAVELDFANRNFSFTFSSPSYVKERLNKFQYKLEGFDEEWNTVDVNQRTVQYTNLLFGDYTFKLRACNSYGYWSQESSYLVTIKPPIWLSTEAFLIYILFISLIVYQTRRVIVARIKLKNELLLEKVKREKDEKLNLEKLRFFTNISHELKTPLSLILGPIKSILEHEKNFDTATNKHHHLIYRNASRLLLLVNQIIDFRKAVAGELKLKVSYINIIEHARLTYESFLPLAQEKEIELHFLCDHEKLEGWIDYDKFDKVLYNLLSNAFKFAPKGSVVELKMNSKTDDKRWLVVEVSDKGVGIPKDYQKKIFTRFFQVQDDDNSNPGTGIGLSFVKKLIIRHHGKVWVESEENKGSNFIFEIPIDKALFENYEIFDIEAESSVASHENFDLSPATKLKPDNAKEKLLLVEDNLDLRSFISGYLSDTYNVYEAENGEEGLEMCKQHKPTLVIADVMMPVMNGIDFCYRLKNNDEISHIPVILLTALSENENKIEGYKTGADDYLVKPFDPILLKARIENIIETRNLLKKRYLINADSGAEMLTNSPVDEAFMQKITKLIDDNIGEHTLNVDFLCKELSVSSSKLYRKLKELTDLSPNDFIRSFRIKKAVSLLQTKEHNVSEVSVMVGFNDPLYFSRCFKKQFGFPPSKLK